jgi:hypothetical protein
MTIDDKSLNARGNFAPEKVEYDVIIIIIIISHDGII